MEFFSKEAGWVLGGLVTFHLACRALGIGGSQPWGHQVIWTGLTFGCTAAWGLLFKDIMPWGYPDLVTQALVHGMYDGYYRLYMTSLALFYTYYAVTSILVDWFPPASDTRWPGVWWTLTHLVILPCVTAAVILDHAMSLRRPVIGVFVSMWLRYQIWLAKDSAISLAVVVIDADTDDGQHEVTSSKSWTMTWLVLQVLRVHSLAQLALWFLDHGKLIGLPAYVLALR